MNDVTHSPRQMQPLVFAKTSPGSATSTRESFIAKYRSDPQFRSLYGDDEASFIQAVEAAVLAVDTGQKFVNDLYQVVVLVSSSDTQIQHVHLMIKRHDGESVTDWEDLQAIKSQIVGSQEEAMELFPSIGRLVDTANQYHLFATLGKGRIFHQGYRTFIEELGSGHCEEFNGHALEIHPNAGGFTHIAIQPLAQPSCRDWRSLQSIKNHVLGESCEAVEFFPAQDQELRDGRFHLFGPDDPTFRFPFGFQTSVVHDIAVGAARNRPLEAKG